VETPLFAFKAVLHVGRPKTASTSFQRLLALNASALATHHSLHVGQPFRDPNGGGFRVSFNSDWIQSRAERNPKAVAAGGGSFQGVLERMRVAKHSSTPTYQRRFARTWNLDTISCGARLMISDESIRVNQISLFLKHFHLAEVVLVVREPISWLISAARQILKSRGGRNQRPEDVVSGLYRGKSWNPQTQVQRIATALDSSLVANQMHAGIHADQGALVQSLRHIRLFAYEAPDFSPSNMMCSIAGGRENLPVLENMHLNVMTARDNIPIEVPADMRRSITNELRQTAGFVDHCTTSAETLATIASYADAASS
jgi:hypothetical protein